MWLKLIRGFKPCQVLKTDDQLIPQVPRWVRYPGGLSTPLGPSASLHTRIKVQLVKVSSAADRCYSGSWFSDRTRPFRTLNDGL